MRTYACTRNIPVGGTAKKPVYEFQTVHVKAETAIDAKLAIDDYQASEKIRLWGTASVNNT